VLGPYRNVLATHGARRLFGSALLARLPQGMSSLATLLLVRASTHSYAAAGVAVGAEALACALAAPALGRLIDRVGRAHVLMRCAVGYALALTALVISAQLHTGAVVLVLAAAVAGGLLPPVAPSLRALLRDVFVDPGTRESAYALESVAQELIWIVGPVIVGVVVAFWSPAAALELVGGVCVLGCALFVRGPFVGAPVSPHRDRQAAGAALSSPVLRALLAPVALTGLALGATEVGLPALALHAGSRTGAGLLLALWSVGSMAGGLWFGSRAWRSSLSVRYATLLVIAVVCTAPLIVAHSIAAGAVFSLLAGVTIAPVFSCQYALVGRSVAPGSETEAFTWVASALVSGIAAGSALGGALVAGSGASAPFVLSCAATALAAVMALVARPAVARRVGQAT
jgi:predicted MFS family arabinose efflux permease